MVRGLELTGGVQGKVGPGQPDVVSVIPSDCRGVGTR